MLLDNPRRKRKVSFLLYPKKKDNDAVLEKWDEIGLRENFIHFSAQQRGAIRGITSIRLSSLCWKDYIIDSYKGKKCVFSSPS